MLLRFVTVAMALVVSAPGLIAQDGNDGKDSCKDEVAKAAKKTAEVESYTFKLEVEIEGSPMPMDPMTFEGKHQKDVATHITGSISFGGQSYDIDAWKKGEKNVYKDPQSGEWKSGAAAGARGGRGGGMMSAGRNIKSPHEEMAGLEKKYKEVSKKDAKQDVDGKECTVFEGPLTEEGAKDMLPGGMGRMLGAAGEVTGTAKLFVDADGIIRKIVLVSVVSASFQGTDLEITTTRTTVLKEIGSTKVEVPEEVKTLLDKKDEDEEKKDEKKKEE